ncbi:MAG: hypothetical protein GKR77_07215, partial [Legionellales bacterium]|nr:hypothetical protein [Legionellales bacterium]
PTPQTTYPPLLIIDDAHELPVTTLDFLVMQTQRPTHGVTGLRFMLCGDDLLLQKLAELPISHETLAHQFHQLTLSPLSLTEMMEYLTKRLSLTQQSLSSAQWHQIHQLADGHIETMLVLAKKMQRDRFANKITSFRRDKVSWWHWLMIGLFFILLTAVLWWGYQANQLPAAAIKSIPSHYQLTTAQLKNIPATALPDANNETISHMNRQPESKVDESEAAMRARQQQLDLIKQELALILIDRKINYVDISKTGFLAMNQKHAQRVGYKESILRAMGEAQLMQAHLAMVQTKKNEVAQRPSGYTIQLLATHNEQALLDFIVQHQLEEQTRYFAMLREGERWYVLTFGQYTTLQAAQRALSTLPAALRAAKPWPRSLASIQVTHTKKE